jgi:hypothetical protein
MARAIAWKLCMENLAGRYYGSPAQSQKKSAGLQPAPLLIILIQTRIIKPHVRIHTVREDGVFQSTRSKPYTLRNGIKKLRGDALEGTVDQRIDVGTS